jgi:hypothetical protein
MDTTTRLASQGLRRRARRRESLEELRGAFERKKRTPYVTICPYGKLSNYGPAAGRRHWAKSGMLISVCAQE